MGWQAGWWQAGWGGGQGGVTGRVGWQVWLGGCQGRVAGRGRAGPGGLRGMDLWGKECSAVNIDT